MDGIDTLQSSTPETKAERIARYKAERRRELAERYGNTEEFTSKYVRRDRKIADSSEMVSSTTKEKERSEDESEQTYTRRGLRSKAEAQFTHADDEPAQEKETTTRLKADSVSSSRSEVVSSAKTSSHLRLLATDDTEEPNVDEKPLDSAKRSATSKMSLFKDLDRTEDGSGAYCAKDRPNCQLIGSDEEETSASPGQICKSREMEEKETTDETFPKEQHECDAFEEEKKQPSLQRQDSGPQGIKGILKKSCSTSVESDHSEGSTSECTPVRQSSITLSHPESEEEQKEHEEEQQEEEEEEDEELEEDDEEEVNGDDDQEEEALPDDITDGGGLSTPRQQREGSYSSSGGSSEGMQSPSPAESLEKSSTVSEDVDELESSLEGSMSSSLKQRLSDFNTSEDDQRNRVKKPKPADSIHTSLADRFSQLHDAENAWKKKKSSVDVGPKMSLADRMKILKDKEEQWKNKGKGAANDSIQFTVAGRMAKRGLVSDTGKEESPLASLRKTHATPVKPHEEISSRTDIKVEGDKRLDKLESFLDKLHNKGVSKTKTSTVEVTAETEKEVMTLDDDETFGNFYKNITPSKLQDTSVVMTEEDLSQIQANTPKLTSAVAEHRRSVRPARRNQGSRNPLRALAARNDIRQVYTEQRLNVASLETKRIQVERSKMSQVTFGGTAKNLTHATLKSLTSHCSFNFPPQVKSKIRVNIASLKYEMGTS